MSDLNLALTESKSLRDNRLQEISNDKALESLNRAKSLLMALWRGDAVATTAQMAEFYEVEEDTVQSVIKRHRDELESDGLKVMRGKSLKDVVSTLNTTSKTPSLTIWTPRAALRLGMLLRDSDVAKSVRDVLLDLVEVVPAQVDAIRELELKLRLAEVERDRLIAEKAVLDTRHLIVSSCPEPIQQKILGYEVVKEIEYRDRILDGDRLINDGSTINKTDLCRRYGMLSRNGKPDYRLLNNYLEHLPSDAFRLSVNIQENYQLHRDFLPMLDRLIDSGDNRQLWLGETL